jgi:quercetin 2,3-dioxygenase
MTKNRKLTRVYTPPTQPGFLGRGHLARPVIQGGFSQSDPFIMLMDDMLDKKDDTPAGGPHPHGGFETVTLVLNGEIGDEKHTMKKGDFQLMTAGKGIVHSEIIHKPTDMRLLQLWLNLPKKNRWAEPRVQDLLSEHVPSQSQDGVQVKLYSGQFAGLESPIKNYVPLIVADIKMDAAVSSIQQLPANYNTFLYVIEGSVMLGEEGEWLKENQVGWLNISAEGSESDLQLKAGENGVRFILYAGKPTGENIVSYGPFIADSSEDIRRLYHEYNQGKLQHISSVPESQRLML